MKNLLKPVEPPFPAGVDAIFENYPKDANGNLISLFRVFANSLRFLGGKGVVNLLDKDSPLSLRERELVILRLTANLDCEYEWGVHVTGFARAAGFSKEQVEATRLGDASSPLWSDEESLLIRCVDDLCQNAQIQEKNYPQFQETWSREQQLEILALCGNYHTVCFVANSTRLGNEPMGAVFPAG